MDKWSLKALADGLLRHALGGSCECGTRTVNSGHSYPLRQAVVALCRGQRLDERYSHGEATVQVIRGRVRVTAGDEVTDGGAGELLIVPGRHTVTAVEDTVVLLTVAQRASPRDTAPAHTAMAPREYGVDAAPTTFDREMNP